MAMLTAKGVHRPISVTLTNILYCLSYSKRIVLRRDLSENYHKVLNQRYRVLDQCTRVADECTQISRKILQPRFLCSAGLNKCWSCGKEHNDHVKFCDDCNKLQPLDRTLNYYEILGLKKSFTVDIKGLTKIFRKLQGQFHPDKFSIRLETEQQYAVDHSSEINKAYRCLLNPVERALYLLDLAGQPLHEGQIDLDPEFLMEIMEVNEELAEATDKEAVANIGQKNQKILDGLLEEADAAFTANNIETARKVVTKIKYYNNIYLKVREYERRHGIID